MRVIKHIFVAAGMIVWGYFMVKLLIAYPDMTPRQQEQFNNMIELMPD